MDNVTLAGNNNVVKAVLGIDGNSKSVATLNAFDSVKGAAAGALNAAKTALTAANAARQVSGNVTVNESTTTTGVTSFGAGAAHIYTNGAASVSVTGTKADTITDVRTTTNGAARLVPARSRA